MYNLGKKTSETIAETTEIDSKKKTNEIETTEIVMEIVVKKKRGRPLKSKGKSLSSMS